MPFISNTQEQREAMLSELGVFMDELFADIPEDMRCGPLNLPAGMNERQVFSHISEISEKNAHSLHCFIGGGFYDHYIPSAVNHIASRSEFYTAYTPYQAEASQGTLQAIYEFQSSICRLTGMEVSNASLYDGGTAIYEAIMMARILTRRNRIIIDDSLNPIYMVMLRSYTRNLNIELVVTQNNDLRVNRENILEQIDDRTAAVILQNPNFFGTMDDFSDIAERAHEKKALCIMSVYPVSLGMLKTPAEMGADIVVGEGQSLGLPLSFGGPYLGFMAAKKKYVRKMPGRIAGLTSDDSGREGFVLTLQAREQHIRRDKASSNICSNEALCALTALVYMSLLGKQGLAETAEICASKARYAYSRLAGIDAVTMRSAENSFFNEFVVDLPSNSMEILGRMIEKGFAAGFPLGKYYPDMENALLVCVTEKRTKNEIGILAETLESVL